MTAIRVALGGLGLAAVAWGAWLLADEGTDRLLSAAIWVAGGIVAHDLVLAPVVVAIGVVAAKIVPAGARAVAAVAFLLWGTLTIAVANVLLDVGGKPGLDSLMNRPYVAAWLVLTGLVIAGTVAIGAVGVRRRPDPAPPR